MSLIEGGTFTEFFRRISMRKKREKLIEKTFLIVEMLQRVAQ